MRASCGGDGLPAEEEEGVNRRRFGPDPSGSLPRQRVPLPSRRPTRTQLSEDRYTDSRSDYEGEWVCSARRRKTGIANAFGTSCRYEAAVESSPSGVVLVHTTNCTGLLESQEGKSRRTTTTTLSPHLDVGEGSDAAVEKDTDSSLPSPTSR
jgi:hypothetical protein